MAELRRQYRHRPALYALIAAAMGCVGASGGDAGVAASLQEVYDAAYARLTHVRDDRKQRLLDFCNGMHALATRAGADPVLRDFFRLKQEYYRLQQEAPPPADAVRAIDEYKATIDSYYLENYRQFYDILFVGRAGDVFYTIRKEAEYQRNLLSGELAQTHLARLLREQPQGAFVDFQYFFPSDEPAAFFVQPVLADGEHLGWLILQCAINKINSIFAGSDELGATGEVFLVNKEQYMLTQSRFIGQSTILSMHLNPDNIRTKFAERAGNRIITDYRGCRALSSFDVFRFLSSEWLIIAKIDEAEVLTDHFREHQAEYLPPLLARAAQPAPPGGPCAAPAPRLLKVDMDEFVKAQAGEALQTRGVSTCTALIAAYPRRFAYLAHISPFDRVYGEGSTDLLGHIVKNIKTYDIYKYERRHVRFVVVARDAQTLPAVLEELLHEGFLLSQVDVVYNPAAQRADVTYDYVADQLCVSWRAVGTEAGVIETSTAGYNLGAVLRQLMEADSASRAGGGAAGGTGAPASR
ncbi:MAG TPA: hypothetical protein PKK06_08645 [Phycisphaerae bacterium]|nr:hypothetical protein [Phycisphaerae bacterium]HNU45222.1 hypothetical protein [Phycisphaerae bacterium]